MVNIKLLSLRILHFKLYKMYLNLVLSLFLFYVRSETKIVFYLLKQFLCYYLLYFCDQVFR